MRVFCGFFDVDEGVAVGGRDEDDAVSGAGEAGAGGVTTVGGVTPSITAVVALGAFPFVAFAPAGVPGTTVPPGFPDPVPPSSSPNMSK